MRQLSAQDAAFLYLESQGAHLHLTALYVYDQSTAPGGIVRHKDVLNYVESRLHTSPVFRQKLFSMPFSIDYPYWIDDDRFDLEFHVRHIALPEPRDWRQLCILAARIHSRRLDLSRPPWEMYLVEGLDKIKGIPEGAFALITKYHHAAVDGASGTEIVSGLHSTTPEFEANPEPQPWQPEPQPSWPSLMARATVNNIRQPFQLAKAISTSLPGISELALKSVAPDVEIKDSVPHTRFNRRVSPHRVFEGESMRLRQLSAIRKAVPGATVNDVVLTICGGALREYLESKGELPEETLFAMAPVNTRTDDDVDVAGNVLAAMIVRIHTDVEDPLARLRSIREGTSRAKATDRAIGARQMTDLTKHVPALTTALAGRLVTTLGLGNRAMRLANCTITNVPGPQQPLYFNGARLLLPTGLGPVIDGVGLFLIAHSYDGDMILSITSCRDIVPDPENLSACLKRSFQKLKKAAAAEAGKKETQPRKKATRQKAG